jgi:hypothetical protein
LVASRAYVTYSGFDAVATCVVRRGQNAVRQGGFETVVPYAVQVLSGRGRRPRRFRLRRAQPWREAHRHLGGFTHVHGAVVVAVAVGLKSFSQLSPESVLEGATADVAFQLRFVSAR